MAKKPQHVIGIDIGSHSIKLVDVQKKGNRFILANAAIYKCEGDWKDGLPEDMDVAGINLGKAIAVFGGVKLANLAIPTSASMVRVVPFESKLKDEELWNTIEANVSQYFPFSADEVFIDYKIVQPSLQVDKHNDVLVVASQKEFVMQRELCADIAGLKLNAIDVDIYAILNLIKLQMAFDHFTTYDAISIIDIGLHHSSLNVITGDGAVYVRDIPIGGDRFTQIIADMNGLSFDDAEKAKLSGDPQIEGAENIFIEEFVGLLKSAIDVYVSNNPQITMHEFFVVGGSTNNPKLVSTVSEKMETPIRIIDLETCLEIDDRVYGKLGSQGFGSLLVATGLAMREYV